MVFRYTKKEIKHFLIAVLTVTFVFAFDDGLPQFDLEHWIFNFFKTFIIVFVGYFVHDLGHDLMAQKLNFISEFKVWFIEHKLWGRKFEYKPKLLNLMLKPILKHDIVITKFPLGIILAIILAFVSNGKLYFTAVSSYGLLVLEKYRIGKKYMHTTDEEDAKIALAGPMAMLLLLTLAKIFNYNDIFGYAIFIYSILIIYDMLPIPGLDGNKVFYGNKKLYIFSLVFTLVSILLFHTLSAFSSLLLSFLVAISVLGAYFYYQHVH